MPISGWRWLDDHSMLVMSMDGHFCQWMVILCFMSATLTLDSRVPLALSYLKTAQPISAIQNVSRVLVFISLQNVSRLLVSISHVFSRTVFSYTVFVCQLSSPMICPTWSKYLHHAFWEPSMQICCSVIAVSSIEWAVLTLHIFIEESEGLLS